LHKCHSVEPLLTLAATDPAALQDVIVGGAVTAAVGAALYSGLKQEPVPCDLCAGNGGIKCFACSGAGSSMDVIDPDILEAQAGRKLARGFTSSSSSRPGSCRVCKGKGLVLCSKCKGSGYTSTF
jgi:DnaJ-class molecular chaperone